MFFVNQLVGFGGFTSSVALTTLTFQNSSTATASSITLPASINAGDLIVIYDNPANSSSTIPTSVVPSGFTSLYDNGLANASNARRVVISYKIAVGTESSTSVTGMNSANNYKAAFVFRPDSTITSVTPSGFTSVLTDSDPSPQVVPSSSGPVPLVVIAGYGVGGGATVNPRTMSPAKDGEVDISGGGNWAAYKVYNSSPADVSVDMDDEGNRNVLVSGYIYVS